MTTKGLVLQRLSSSLPCMDVVLRRYCAGGQVWLLAADIDCLPKVRTWYLRQKDPALTSLRLRLSDANMHPRLAFTLPVVRRMALMCRGPAAQSLFELVSAEIEAGRHFFPERPE